MDALLVNGDELELTPDPPWKWMVPPVRVKLNALPGHRMKSDGEYVIWETEILSAGLLAVGQMYSAPGFDAPGSVLSMTLTVTPGTMSATIKDVQQPVATVATSGTFVASVVPAMNPGTGVPDPVVVKTGTWSVATQVQNIALSGQPKAQSADGADDEAPLGGVGGANTSDVAPGESKDHYVAVELEDVDGNKLAQSVIRVLTPDGETHRRELTASGAARVDGIPVDGEATVVLLGALRTRIPKSNQHSIAFELKDENGFPVPGAEVECTFPDGSSQVKLLGPQGVWRIDALPEAGDCVFKVLRLTRPYGSGGAVPTGKSWLELELVDQDQCPVPDARYEVSLAGRLVCRGRLNEEGTARVSGLAPKPHDVVFPDYPVEGGAARMTPSSGSSGGEDWLELEVTDQAGNPVPNARYEVQVAPNDVRAGTADSDGIARVEGLPAGNYDIVFPDFAAAGNTQG